MVPDTTPTLLQSYCTEFAALSSSMTQVLQQLAESGMALGEDLPHVTDVREQVQGMVNAIDAVLSNDTNSALDAITDLPDIPVAPIAPVVPTDEAEPEQPTVESLFRELTLDHPEPSPADGERTLQGTNESMPIAAMFSLTGSTKKTGTLLVRTPQETLAFDFIQGQLVGSCTDTRGIDQPVGDLLVAQGAVERSTLDEFIAEFDGSPPRFGQALVSRGLVSAEALAEALSTQFARRFYRAFSAPASAYVMDETRNVDGTDTPVRLAVEGLLFEAARELDETGRDD